MTPPSVRASSDAFESFVSDVASALDDVIPSWRARIAAAATEHRARGTDTTVLERAASLPGAPDVDALLATFGRAVRQLAAYEAEAVALDPSLAGSAVFRDPTRVREAAALVAARRTRGDAARNAAKTAYPEPEHWVLHWPDVGDLLAGDLA